ncbi:hypothetical protein CC78DRAFT_215157 [Lojkania enalia]|uniref:Uncharacterized protein n=1 Tax=Lojkania enalia TaxID=147567 RepID=A0A9P4KC18_9PLEO|nr:hypothetical protein CC78DRAFT_215157 [Didymosphaeria enalia]
MASKCNSWSWVPQRIILSQPTLRERIMGRLTEHHHDEEKAQLDFTQVIPDCKETQKNYYRLDEIHEGSYVTVVRNTAADTPNLTLNIRNQVGRADLYVVAVCGIILQLGSLLYFWFATYYPSLRFPKDGDRVAQYAFPCAAAGTLLLVTGILICSHTVEDSTLEKSYRPMPGKQARVVWIQRSSTVNEQEFQSFAVFPSESQALIKTSHRTQRYPANKLVYGKRRRQKALNHLTDLVLNVLVANSMKEIMVVIGVLISLCGYIVQFVGFRGLHWSASVVQLGVIAVMAVLRVWVRRNLAIIPRSQPLLSDHEMDWLALTLGGDYTKAPWLDTSKASGDKSSTLWAQSGSCIWEIQGVEYAENLKKLEQHKLSGPREAETSAPTVEERQNINGHQTLYLSQNNQISESWSNPHICMRVRRDIGRLADWHGPASAEAISLARAIEFTMDALLPSLTGTFTWSINTSSGPIHFQIKREPTGTWKSLSDELEAALSLWLYALYDKEQGYQAKNKYEKELPIAFERTDQQREEKLNQKTRPHEHEKSDDDSWLRAKGMHAKRSVRLLGPYTQRLCQDLRWWMPDAGVNIFEVRQQESADSDIYEVEPHRIVGIVPKIGSNITQSTGGPYARLYRAQKSSNSLDISYLSDPVTQEGTLAIESHSHLKGILAQHLFSAFMWAVAKKLTRPVPGGAQIHSTKASSLEGFSGLPLCSLRNTRITQMAHSIESTGLGELEMIYACIIAPLSMENKLPRTDSIVAWTRQAASPYEQGGDWEAAIYAYLSLFKVSEAFPKYDPIFIRATALLMENLRAIATTANIKKLQHVEDYQKSYQEDEIIKALKPYDDILGNIMGLYERQGRSWNCDIIVTVKPLREKNDMLKFTELHNKLFTSPRSFTRQRSDVGKEDILGWRPLHYAVARGSDMSIRKFLSMKTDINARDIRGQTPLHYAYRHDDVIARTLLGAGAEVEAQDFDGLAPLHCAAIHGNITQDLHHCFGLRFTDRHRQSNSYGKTLTQNCATDTARPPFI